ncbi:hypothetical protein [Longimicrobium terrae]|uniref:Uncharacterized protein n=1 Tax=Longimicrobium terrae TaxID=1639882 RepID=A0A841GXT4_9BACT|nr:hypothetical protein [Longimicrobium terrae]MBB4636162.1 hypothetical protein [Longimicrobium terrae]MBB6070557.1 hypothetical protein [Longimicrobium terrae]NNC29543.1 hypothetical protein [Longimicrobium terrae]
MRLIRGIDRGISADRNPPFRRPCWLAASALMLAACAGDGVTAPELSPAPAGKPVVIRLDGGNGPGIPANEPIVFIVNGQRVTGDVFRMIDASRIDSIELRRKGADRPENEVHITLRPPPR